MMVGDSFDRDVRPAKAIGMQTAWLEGPAGRDCPDRALADVSLRALADLPEVLDRAGADCRVTAGADGRAVRAGVIAAGRGDRLRHVTHTLKPLVRVGGRTLVERVLLSLAEARPVEVVIIVNETSAAVKDHVTASRTWPFAVRWIVETTPSSMHSFLRVVETLAEDGERGPFLISTVDTIAAPGAFGAFAAASREPDADVTLAVTPPTDDEKPLLVRLGPDGASVEAIGERSGSSRTLRAETGRTGIWATAGYYAVRSSVLREADEARHDGVGALRLFFERLLARGYRLACGAGGRRDRCRPPGGRPRRGDVSEAGRSVMRLIGLYREAECSPGRHRSNDAQLLELVGRGAGGARVPRRTDDAGGSGPVPAIGDHGLLDVPGPPCARPADALGARGHAPDQQPPGGAEHVPRSASGDSCRRPASGFRRRRSSRPRASTIRRST